MINHASNIQQNLKHLKRNIYLMWNVKDTDDAASTATS